MTLISSSRCSPQDSGATKVATLGSAWRVRYPNHFGRDALCCDVILPTSESTEGPSRIRLVNVHSDSLPVRPSFRPRQLQIVSSYLSAVGHGLVAGDFNPVLPEDDALVNGSHLVTHGLSCIQMKTALLGGIDGDVPFPPNRMDKVAMLGLEACDIQVIPPGTCMDTSTSGRDAGEGTIERLEQEQYSSLRWSDHSGLLCLFELQ